MKPRRAKPSPPLAAPVLRPNFVQAFTVTRGKTAGGEIHVPTKTPACPLIAITPGAMPVAFSADAARPGMVNDPFAKLEVDYVLAIHRLLIPWRAVSAPAPGCPWSKVGHVPAARLALLLLRQAQRPGASVGAVVAASRAIERLVMEAEDYESATKAAEPYRTYYTAAAFILADTPGMKPAALWEAVETCLPPSAAVPSKAARAKWLARYPYRLPPG